MDSKKKNNPKAVVIGGGIAGLAAASSLGLNGWNVELHESRPRLGGRASSFQDKTTNELIDNCQHVSMGCCTNFENFCQTTGLASYFRTEPELYFIGPDHKVNRFGSSLLPAPFHLAFSFFRLSYLSSRQKLEIARGIRSLINWKKKPGKSETFAEWILEQNQSEYVTEHFWKVILTSALSETPDQIDIAYARKVILDGFVANKKGWTVSIPKVPLETLYGDVLLNWFSGHQIRVHTGSSISKVDVKDGRVLKVITSQGTEITADEYIIAVSPARLSKLFDPETAELLQIPQVEKLKTAPISSIHLWFDRPVMNLPHAVITGKMIQWVFNRNLLQSVEVDSTSTSSWYYQVVISASHDLLNRPQQEIIDLAIRELGEIWNEISEATVLHSRMVTEHQAVISVTPESDESRLPQKTAIENLNFAGDWTQTGWPSTMEGATRSGYLAVTNILNHPNSLKTLPKPDLPVSWVSQLLFDL